MPGKIRKVSVDLSKVHDDPLIPITLGDARRNPHEQFARLPFDCPAYLSVKRKYKTDKDDKIQALTGHEITIDFWTYGVIMKAVVDMGGKLKLYVKDEEGVEKLMEWERE